MPDSLSPPSVLIVGGGLAGIAAAVALREAGCAVTLLESRQQLGGRSTSYVDSATGESIDNCQHVSMGCCTNLRHLAEALEIRDLFATAESLHFVAPDGRIVPFAADPLPAPFHLLRSFLRLPYLNLSDKIRFARGVSALAKASPESLSGVPFQDWLAGHGQTPKLIRSVWEVVLVSALSETLDRVDARYARKVFVDGFLVHRDGWQVEIPTVSLEELYSRRALQGLERRNVTVRLNDRVVRLEQQHGRISRVHLRGDNSLNVDHLVLAVPQHQVASLLPEDSRLNELKAQVSRIETAPITSVHLWFDRPMTDLPHAVLVERFGQWLFNRGSASRSDGNDPSPGAGGFLYQVVISASRDVQGRTQPDIAAELQAELADIWPVAKVARLLHSRVITERRAVFSVTPGIDSLRPSQETPVSNLFLAGDWTATGWPGTMEGAVRSGYLAAESLLQRHGVERQFVQPDLPVQFWPRLLFGLKASPQEPRSVPER